MKALIKHEIKTVWFAMLVAVVGALFSYIIISDVKEDILASFINNYFREATFYEFYSGFSIISLIPILAGVTVLVILQFKDYSKINISHFLTSLPVKTSQVYITKLSIGTITIGLYFIINAISTVIIGNKNIEWVKQMKPAGINEMFLEMGVIVQQALYTFVIILVFYFFLVFMQYIVTNVYASVVFGWLAAFAGWFFAASLTALEDLFNLPIAIGDIGNDISDFLWYFFTEPLYNVWDYERFGELFEQNIWSKFALMLSIILFLFMSIKYMNEKEGLKISQNLIVTKKAQWIFKIFVTYFMFFIPMLFGLKIVVLNIAVGILGYIIANKISKM
ncbi:hypothetical protein AN640_04025 [Candidatus Epulonipiscium fishelsonii]|uniref:Uncharacterized protein n=1 Tax=Candidatus Epulonipiscium fishelsonii TaxID=77094 RepID=A0ACC8XJ37_9FIRM|nr:hypothetical protein AN640_04025 [Epulopiscium sp. SCG-D08WGA-EpuloA1]OON91003.1 MAG: hypothetical protein ATN32_02820 [Epulopiscium sp. AS2M-Bin002]